MWIHHTHIDRRDTPRNMNLSHGVTIGLYATKQATVLLDGNSLGMVFIRTHQSYSRFIMAAEQKLPGRNFLAYKIFVDGVPLVDNLYGRTMALQVDGLPGEIEFRTDFRAAAETKKSETNNSEMRKMRMTSYVDREIGQNVKDKETLEVRQKERAEVVEALRRVRKVVLRANRQANQPTRIEIVG